MEIQVCSFQLSIMDQYGIETESNNTKTQYVTLLKVKEGRKERKVTISYFPSSEKGNVS